jgi:hypothetical protein
VRLKAPKIINGRRQVRAVEQVARGVPVSAGVANFQREIIIAGSTIVAASG